MTKQDFTKIFTKFLEEAEWSVTVGNVKLLFNDKNFLNNINVPLPCDILKLFVCNDTKYCLWLKNEEIFLSTLKETYKVFSAFHLSLLVQHTSGKIPVAFILTGPDNVGKSTVVKALSELFKCDTRHQNMIPGSTNQETWQNHQKLYNDIVSSEANSSIIFDRFIEDEFVYGIKYRGGNIEEVKSFIWDIEEKMRSKYKVIYVTLSGDPEFLLNNDDGHSLSQNKFENIKYEIESFKLAFMNSIFNYKKYVKVNKGDKFKDINDIIKEILNGKGVYC